MNQISFAQQKDLLYRTLEIKILSKIDLKFGFQQIQIKKEDKYKIAFTVPFGQYEWNVMLFGLKNIPSEFQKFMNKIFNVCTKFIIVYIDDMLILSNSIEQHFKHMQTFLNLVVRNGLFRTKMEIFETKIRFIRQDILKGPTNLSKDLQILRTTFRILFQVKNNSKYFQEV